MLQDDESLALALRGGLRGRFQGTFNQLENAVEVLDDYVSGRYYLLQYQLCCLSLGFCFQMMT